MHHPVLQQCTILDCSLQWNFGVGGLHLQRPVHRHTAITMRPLIKLFSKSWIACTASLVCQNILPKRSPYTCII